jgi:hypothetical protein
MEQLLLSEQFPENTSRLSNDCCIGRKFNLSMSAIRLMLQLISKTTSALQIYILVDFKLHSFQPISVGYALTIVFLQQPHQFAFGILSAFSVSSSSSWFAPCCLKSMNYILPMYLKGFPSFMRWLRHSSTTLDVQVLTFCDWYALPPIAPSIDYRKHTHTIYSLSNASSYLLI